MRVPSTAFSTTRDDAAVGRLHSSPYPALIACLVDHQCNEQSTKSQRSCVRSSSYEPRPESSVYQLHVMIMPSRSLYPSFQGESLASNGRVLIEVLVRPPMPSCRAGPIESMGSKQTSARASRSSLCKISPRLDLDGLYRGYSLLCSCSESWDHRWA